MMSRRSGVVVAVVAVAMCSALLSGVSSAAGKEVAAGARGGVLSGSWGTAQEVPGTAALNKGGNGGVNSVSCASAGNCGAAGSYTDGSGHFLAFVVTEKNGSWGTAEKVPGVVNRGGTVAINSVSCGSPGNCSASGSYIALTGASPAFVVNQTNGVWGTSEKLPGRLNLGRGAGISSVSCATAGNCSAGGFYAGSSGHPQAFAVTEKNGVWGTAKEVPGTAALNNGGNADVSSVSCRSPGNCSAVGSYTDSSGHFQAFVAGQKNGVWGTAKEIPGTAALNRGGDADVTSVSCTSPGNCSAGGSYTDGSGRHQVFLVTETNGAWGSAEEVPGSAALNKGGSAEILSVSCAPAGNCSAGGDYYDASHHLQAFAVSQT